MIVDRFMYKLLEKVGQEYQKNVHKFRKIQNEKTVLVSLQQ